MYQLRLPCLDALFQPLPLRQIVVYLADGTTPAPVFNLDDEPRSASFLTDLSGDIDTTTDLLTWLNLGVVDFAMPTVPVEITFSAPNIGVFDLDATVLPIGANDGDWYYVASPGSFGTNNKTTMVGDYVQFISLLSDIVVVRIPLDGIGAVETIFNKTDDPDWFQGMGSSEMYPSVAGLEKSLRMLQSSIQNNTMGIISGNNYARYFDDFLNIEESKSKMIGGGSALLPVLQFEVSGDNMLGVARIVAGTGDAVGAYKYSPNKVTGPVTNAYFNMFDGSGVIEMIASFKFNGNAVANSYYFFGLERSTDEVPFVSVIKRAGESNFILKYQGVETVSSFTPSMDTVITMKLQILYTDGIEVRLFINSDANDSTEAVAGLTSLSSGPMLNQLFPSFGIYYDGTMVEDEMNVYVDYCGVQTIINPRPNFGFSHLMNGIVYPSPL